MERKYSFEIGRICDATYSTMEVLASNGVADTVYISAGSALSVLDWALHRSETRMSDLDINIVVGQTADISRFRHIAAIFKNSLELRLVPESFKDMRRSLSGPDGITGLYIAGYRVFVASQNLDMFVDLSMFHVCEEALQNGYLNTQLVKIPIKYPKKLTQVLDEIRSAGYHRAVSMGLLIDLHSGYLSALQRDPVVIYPNQIALDPCRVGIRIISEFARYGKTIPDDVVKLVNININQQIDIKNDVRNIRNLRKLFFVDQADLYIEYLYRMNVVSQIDEKFSFIIDRHRAQFQRAGPNDEMRRSILASLRTEWETLMAERISGY